MESEATFRALGRHRSTVGREIRAGCGQRRSYRALAAERKSRERIESEERDEEDAQNRQPGGKEHCVDRAQEAVHAARIVPLAARGCEVLAPREDAL